MPKKKIKKDGTPSKQGEGGGRPMKYKTVQELNDAINRYFANCDAATKQKVVVVDGEPKLVNAPNPIPYTIEELAVALGVDRDTLLNYEKDEKNKKFFGTIKEAKDKILGQKMRLALMKETHPLITIFDLKNNYGYEDKKVIDQTNRDGGAIDPLDVGNLDPNENK